MTTTQLRSLNDIGSRLRWVRESLGITKSKVALDNMMAISSYSDRENGIRTHYPEEYKALAEYFAHLWRLKYTRNHPMFNGNEIKVITTMWIMFGVANE